jgi:oligosaccharide reducing-end xylanase
MSFIKTMKIPIHSFISWSMMMGLLLVGYSAQGETAGGAVATGHYRHLFVEAGHTPAAVSAKIKSAFQQLFYGDPATEAVYFPSGTNQNGALAYIFDTANRDVRSEGMSYGMMIAVQLDKKSEFDALWNWARTFMYQTATNHPARGYFAWSAQTNGVANDDMPAADGEEYLVTALFFASARWGDGAGIFNYQSEAKRILADLKNRVTITGPTGQGEKTCVVLFSSAPPMVRFTPDAANSEHTDPSYHLPAFYEVWARWGSPEDRSFWREAAAVSRDYFPRAAHPVTGLTPEYANFDGSPWAAPWRPDSADFRFDAWRTAMNWSVDWAWWAKDARARELSNRLLGFFESQGLTNYANQFTLAGKPLSTDHSPGLAAMNAVAALAVTDVRANLFVEEFWRTPVPSGEYRYYDGMLYLLGLLHCSGEFRAWLPK